MSANDFPHLGGILASKMKLNAEDAELPPQLLLLMHRGLSTSIFPKLVRASNVDMSMVTDEISALRVVKWVKNTYPDLAVADVYPKDEKFDSVRAALLDSFRYSEGGNTLNELSGMREKERRDKRLLRLQTIRQLLLMQRVGYAHEPLVLLHCAAFDPKRYGYVLELLEADLAATPDARRLLTDML